MTHYLLTRSPALRVLDLGRDWLRKGRPDLARECIKMARTMQNAWMYNLLTDTVTAKPYYLRMPSGTWRAALRFDHGVRERSWVFRVFPTRYAHRQSAQRAAEARLKKEFWL